MNTPLGAICIESGSMTREQVQQVLTRLAKGEGARFGDLALEAGYLDERGLQRALATQYSLNLLPDDVLGELRVPAKVRGRLPLDLVRGHLLVPVGLPPDGSMLTLVGPDPTDILGLRAARSHAGCDVRLLLGTRSGVMRLVERLYGPSRETGRRLPARPGLPLKDHAQKDLVLEPDPARLALLERLDAMEGGAAEFAAEPEQVAPLLEAGGACRLIYRRDLEELVAPYLEGWRRLRADLQLCPVHAMGPASQPAVDSRRAARFYQEMLRFAILGSEERDADARIRAWRVHDLAGAVARRLGMPASQEETVSLGALLSELDHVGFLKRAASTPGASGSSRFSLARAILAAFPSPHGAMELLEALEHRMGGGGPIGAHVGAEVVYSVRSIVRRQGGHVDVATILGDNAAHHWPGVVEAVAGVLRWEALHGEPDSMPELRDEVIVALRDLPLLTSVELGLAGAGYRVVPAATGQEAMRLARVRRPVCLLADLALPRMGGAALLQALKGHPATADLPVVFVADPSPGREGADVLEMGADDVVVRPVDMHLLIARIRRVASRFSSRGEQGVRGGLADLPLKDLLAILTNGGRSGVVKVQAGDQGGEVGLDRGRLSYARLGEQVGEPALRALLATTSGTFRVAMGEEPPSRNLTGGTEWLMMAATEREGQAGQG